MNKKLKRIAALSLLVGTISWNLAGDIIKRSGNEFFLPKDNYSTRIAIEGDNYGDIARFVYYSNNYAYMLAYFNKASNPDVLMIGDEVLIPRADYLAEYCIERGFSQDVYSKENIEARQLVYK